MEAKSLNEAYADLLVDVDDSTRRRLTEALGGTAAALPPRHDVLDLLDRITGRITFEEYLRRSRARRR